MSGISIAHLCGLFLAVPYVLFLQIVDVLRTSYKFLNNQSVSGNRILLDRNSLICKKWRRLCLKSMKKITFCSLCFSRLGRNLRVNRKQRGLCRVLPDDEEANIILTGRTEQFQRSAIHMHENKEKEEFENAEIEEMEILRMKERVKSTQNKVEQQAVRNTLQRERDFEGQSLEAEDIAKRKKKTEDDDFQAEVDAEMKWRKEQRESQYQAASKKAAEEVIAKKDIKKSNALEIPSDSYFNEKMFDSVWTSMSISGKFLCKLKESPLITVLVKHLETQGFHIASTTSFGNEGVGSGVEFEVRFCNILNRPQKEGLFLCKFTVVKNTFTASMKAENLDDIAMHVKRFALAKILKVDIRS